MTQERKTTHLSKDYNNLKEIWDYKNNKIKIDEISPGSNKKSWWICDKGHSYEMPPSTRLKKDKKYCPYCQNTKILPGYNDLKTKYPEIIKKYWDYNKNTIDPTKIAPKSSKQAWWKCDKGHSYEMPITKKTSRGYKCPYCSNIKILTGYNDLLTTHATIVNKYWDYNKNHKIGLNPQELGHGKKQKHGGNVNKTIHTNKE